MREMKLNFCPFQTGQGVGGQNVVYGKKLAYKLKYISGSVDMLSDTMLAPVAELVTQRNVFGRGEDKTNVSADRDFLPGDLEDTPYENLDMTGMDIFKYVIDHGELPGGIGWKPGTKEAMFAEMDEARGNKSSSSQKSKKKDIDYEEDEETGIVEFVGIKNGERTGTVIIAEPCCPFCGKLIPRQWVQADAYCGISILGGATGGKTTYLSMLMYDGWDEIDQKLSAIDEAFNVNPVVYKDTEVKTWQVYSNRLKERGICPPGTKPAFLCSPMMFEVEYKDEKREKPLRIIVALHDNAGGNWVNILDNDKVMDAAVRGDSALIYLVEPRQLDNFQPEQEQNRREEVKSVASLLEQASIQREGDTAKNSERMSFSDDGEEYVPGVLEILKKVEQSLRMYPQKASKNVHLSFCLAKIDKLENNSMLDQFKVDKPGAYHYLFQRDDDISDDEAKERKDPDYRRTLAEYEREFIKKFVLKNDTFVSRRFKDVSWHCISSLGADTEESNQGDDNGMPLNRVRDNGRNSGRPKPIRIADPVIECILSMVSKLREISEGVQDNDL